MADKGRGAMRPPGRSPPFLIIGLLVALCILGFNYWNLSSRNGSLSNEIWDLQDQVKSLTGKKMSAEKRSETVLDRLREMEESSNKIKQELTVKQNEIAQISSQLTEAKTNLQTLEGKVNEGNQAKDECQSRLKTCEENTAGIQQELQKVKEERDRLKAAAETKGPAPEGQCTDAVTKSKREILEMIEKSLGAESIIRLNNAGLDVGDYKQKLELGDAGKQNAANVQNPPVVNAQTQAQDQAQAQAQDQAQAQPQAQDQAQAQAQAPPQDPNQAGGNQQPAAVQNQTQQDSVQPSETKQVPAANADNTNQQAAQPAGQDQGQVRPVHPDNQVNILPTPRDPAFGGGQAVQHRDSGIGQVIQYNNVPVGVQPAPYDVHPKPLLSQPSQASPSNPLKTITTTEEQINNPAGKNEENYEDEDEDNVDVNQLPAPGGNPVENVDVNQLPAPGGIPVENVDVKLEEKEYDDDDDDDEYDDENDVADTKNLRFVPGTRNGDLGAESHRVGAPGANADSIDQMQARMEKEDQGINQIPQRRPIGI